MYTWYPQNLKYIELLHDFVNRWGRAFVGGILLEISPYQLAQSLVYYIFPQGNYLLTPNLLGGLSNMHITFLLDKL